MQQTAWSCLGEVVSKRLRPIAFGIFELTLAPVSALGALLGYGFNEVSSWRVVFWLNFGLNALAMGLVTIFYHPKNQYVKEEGKTKCDQILRLDWVGLGLFTSGLVLFLIGLSFGGSSFPWKSAGTLAPLLIGAVLLVLCCFWEAHIDSLYALFPHPVMDNLRGFSVILRATFLVGMLYYSTLILWPQEIQVLFTTDPIKIGLYSIALGGGGGPGGLLAGWLLRFNCARWFLVSYATCLTLICGLQAVINPGTYIVSTIFVVLIGALISAVTVTANEIIQLRVEHQYIGVAMGLIATFRSVGESVASVIYTTILKNKLSSNLGPDVATALVKAGLPLDAVAGTTEAIASGNSSSSYLTSTTLEILGTGISVLKLMYANAFKVVYLLSMVFGVVGMVFAFFTLDVGHLMTNHMDIKLAEGENIVVHDDRNAAHVIQHDGEEIKM